MLMSFTIHRLFHPLMRMIGKVLIRFSVTVFEVHPLPASEPIIFVGNHSNVHDLPMMLSILPKHFFVLADDEPQGTPAGLAFEMNGVIWVNPPLYNFSLGAIS